MKLTLTHKSPIVSYTLVALAISDCQFLVYAADGRKSVGRGAWRQGT